MKNSQLEINHYNSSIFRQSINILKKTKKFICITVYEQLCILLQCLRREKKKYENKKKYISNKKIAKIEYFDICFSFSNRKPKQ